MRHRQRGYKLGRSVGARRSLLKNLARSAFLHETITTTEAKAKAVRPLIEHSITIAREGNLQAYRLLRKDYSEQVVNKLITEIAPRFHGRSGGYISLIPAGLRRGDGATKTIITLMGGNSTKDSKANSTSGDTTVKAVQKKPSK